MADQLYLSYWLRGFTEHNMLRHFEKLLKLFPFSRLSRQASVLRIIPVDYQQPAAFERAYSVPADLSQVLSAAKEFENADVLFQLDSAWDVWQHTGNWQIAPARIALCCFAPEFDNEVGDHLRIEFGIDSYFLPQPDVPGSSRMVQSNIRSLLTLVHSIDDELAAERRQLWTESGENFLEKLQAALNPAEGVM